MRKSKTNNLAGMVGGFIIALNLSGCANHQSKEEQVYGPITFIEAIKKDLSQKPKTEEYREKYSD